MLLIYIPLLYLSIHPMMSTEADSIIWLLWTVQHTNGCVWSSLWNADLGSFGCISRSGVTGLYSNAIFSSLRIFHIVCHSGCTLFWQQSTKAPSSYVLTDNFVLFVLFWFSCSWSYPCTLFSTPMHDEPLALLQLIDLKHRPTKL